MNADPVPFAPVPGWPRGVSRALCCGLLGLVASMSGLLWPQWRDNPDLAHGFVAPLFFLLLISESRRRGPWRWLPNSQGLTVGVTAAVVLGFALFALAGLVAASLAWSHALVLFLLAIALSSFLLAGLLILAEANVRVLPFNWVSLTAIFLWVLVTPLPPGTYTRLTLALQSGVTASVMGTLHLLGIAARQHGNVIELARTTVGVEDACSGIRSLLSCLFVGFFLAAWLGREPKRRWALIVSAPLLALAMNFLRSIILTLLANSGVAIGGAWHDVTGYAILGVTTAVLLGLALHWEISTPSAPPAPDPSSRGRSPRLPLVIFATGFVATIALAGFYFANARPPLKLGRAGPDLTTFLPSKFAGWDVAPAHDLAPFADILGTKNLLERTYVRSAGNGRFHQFSVYIAYWAPGQASVSRVAIHTPDACWPGAGWTVQSAGATRQNLLSPALKTVAAEQRLFKNSEGLAQHVWFWHVYDGRVIDYRETYALSALVKTALQYGFRRQGEQFFVRFASDQAWGQLAQEPLVREILAQLSAGGL